MLRVRRSGAQDAREASTLSPGLAAPFGEAVQRRQVLARAEPDTATTCRSLTSSSR